MKKLLVILTCILILSACAPKEEHVPHEPQSVPIEDLIVEPKTMGDAYRKHTGYTITEDYIKIITEDYVYEGEMTPELNAQLDAIDFFDEKKDEKYADVLDALEIKNKYLREESKLTDEQISNLIGQKGQELLDLGFENVGYNLSEDSSSFFMEKDGYVYDMFVEEHVVESEEFDAVETLANCTIKDIQQSN